MTETLTTPLPTRPDLLANRITPREVLDAYRETGLTPAHLWLDGNDACALGAIAGQRAIREDKPLFVPNEVPGDAARYICRIVGLDDDYFYGFANGFDSNGYSLSANSQIRKGYRDGARAAKFCFKEES